MSVFSCGRVVTIPCGNRSSTTAYECLSLVYNSANGNSYIAKQAVPAGTALTDEDYWMLSSEYSAQYADLAENVETLKAQVAANVAASTDPDADYAAEVVDARIDSEGENYDSLGEAVRSITSGLTPKIMPSNTGVAVSSTSGNTATVELAGRTIKADYSYLGTSYVGLFAGFFGTYADVSDKTIRVVLWCDTETSFEVLITNAKTAWGSSDGSVQSLSLGSISFTEDNHYRAQLDIDFSTEKIADYAAGLTEGYETLYFCLRKANTTTESEGTVYFYAYEPDERRDLLWKYVTLYDDILLLQDEIEAARNDGTEYSTLQEVLLAHRADIDSVMQEVEDAKNRQLRHYGGFPCGAACQHGHSGPPKAPD